MPHATMAQRKMWTKPAPSLPVVDGGMWCSSLIWNRYGRLRGGTRLLAMHAGATERAAKNWLEGRCVPQLKHMARIILADDAIKAAVHERISGGQPAPAPADDADEGTRLREENERLRRRIAHLEMEMLRQSPPSVGSP